MTSVCGDARFTRSSSSSPSISRIDRSVITRSNGPSSPSRDSASRPDAAVATRKPSWTSASRVISRISRSSSTTSTRLSKRRALRSRVSVAQIGPEASGVERLPTGDRAGTLPALWADPDAPALDHQPPLGVQLDRARVELVLDGRDALGQRGGCVVLAHVDRALQDHGTRVVLL